MKSIFYVISSKILFYFLLITLMLFVRPSIGLKNVIKHYHQNVKSVVIHKNNYFKLWNQMIKNDSKELNDVINKPSYSKSEQIIMQSNVDTLQELSTKANLYFPVFENIMKNVIHFDNQNKDKPPIFNVNKKSLNRAQKKALNDYESRSENKYNSILDMCRCYIVCDDFQEMKRYSELLENETFQKKNGFTISKFKNRCKKETLTGFRDYLYNIKVMETPEMNTRNVPAISITDYFICEIVLVHKNIWLYEKEHQTHNIYKFFRGFYLKNKNQYVNFKKVLQYLYYKSIVYDFYTGKIISNILESHSNICEGLLSKYYSIADKIYKPFSHLHMYSLKSTNPMNNEYMSFFKSIQRGKDDIVVCSYNIDALFIHYKSTNYFKICTFIDTAIECGVEILCFQEVWERGIMDMICDIAESHNYYCYTPEGVSRKYTVGEKSGLLTISKYPIKNKNFLLYSDCKGTCSLANKGCQILEFEIGGKALNILNTHLQSSFNHHHLHFQSIATSQIEELMQHMKRQDNNHFILCGDLNLDYPYMMSFLNDYLHLYDISLVKHKIRIENRNYLKDFYISLPKSGEQLDYFLEFNDKSSLENEKNRQNKRNYCKYINIYKDPESMSDHYPIFSVINLGE